MVTSLTSATGWIARFILSAAVLCFNVPRFVVPNAWTHQATTEHADKRTEASKAGFHVTVTVGRGKRQVTLEFGRAEERTEDEVL